MNMRDFDNKLKRYELVELIIPVGSTNTRFPYPDIPQLRDDTTQDIIICGLETFSVEVMPLSANGNAVASFAQLENSFLVLYIDGEESVRQVPFVRLNPMRQAASAGTTFNVYGTLWTEYLKVDWNKSYVQAAAPYGSPLATQFSIMLGVWYKKLPSGTWATMTQGMVQGW
jgi:hypothetical protein